MIKVQHLTKCYGDCTAVDDLSFEIGKGRVYGFLGPNGAGKSTTMNIITGCLSATAGRVSIGGHDILEEPRAAKRLIGYLPEQPPLYLAETPEEYLRFVGEAKGLRGAELKRQMEEAIAKTKLEGMRSRRIAALSKGYKQRVGIAQALLGHPEVIVLDEPTVGLDPLQIIEIRELIRELGASHTVIFSSHILSEVQAICDEILIIAKGKLVAFDRAEALEKNMRAASEITATAEASAEECKEILQTVQGITEARTEAIETAEQKQEIKNAAAQASKAERQPEQTGTTEAKTSAPAPRTRLWLRAEGREPYEISKALFYAFAGHGRALLEMNVKRADLEAVFLELTRGEAPQNGQIAAQSSQAEVQSAQTEAQSGQTPSAQHKNSAPSAAENKEENEK